VRYDDDDDNVDNESYSDFEPEIARKIKKTVRHLSSDSESGSAEKQDSDDKSEIYAAGRNCNIARTSHYFKLKNLLERNSGVRQICADSIIVSGGLPGDMRKHMLEKIIGGGQGK